jgi:hypothetical protein
MPSKRIVFFSLLMGLSLAVCSTDSGDDQFVYSGFSGSNLTLDGAANITHQAAFLS